MTPIQPPTYRHGTISVWTVRQRAIVSDGGSVAVYRLLGRSADELAEQVGAADLWTDVPGLIAWR